MDTIIMAIPLKDHKIVILTSSCISGIFDVKLYLNGSAFNELPEVSYFRLVRPAHYGIAWPYEQDFSSDTIIWDIQNTYLWPRSIFIEIKRELLSFTDVLDQITESR